LQKDFPDMRSTFSVSAAAAELGGMAREAVRWHRATGAKVGAALERAAADLGLTARRVKALHYGEPVALRADELVLARQRWRIRLDHEAHMLEQRAALLRARCHAMADGPAA
jgi:hypothetical protein